MNRGKRRSRRSSSSGVGGDLLAKPGTSQRENSVSNNDATLDERIRMQAYRWYLERGAEPNADVRNWPRAERECTKHPLAS